MNNHTHPKCSKCRKFLDVVRGKGEFKGKGIVMDCRRCISKVEV